MVLSPTLLLPVLLAAAPAPSTEFTAEEFRIYCGWTQELAKDENKAAAQDKLMAKVSKMAKVAPKMLKTIVQKGDGAGGSCEAIAKSYETKARGALNGSPLQARLDSFTLDLDDPTHVVAYVAWKGDQEKRLEEEASFLAWAIGANAPIVRTASFRAIDPQNDALPMFEGKIIPSEQMRKIEKDRIESFADARYVRLFDGVTWANPAAHPNAKH